MRSTAVSHTLKVSTNRKEGTATRGWGRAVKRVHSSAERGEMPRATNTVETARPSGMLCSPMASVTRTPCMVVTFSAGKSVAFRISLDVTHRIWQLVLLRKIWGTFLFNTTPSTYLAGLQYYCIRKLKVVKGGFRYDLEPEM